MKDHFSLRTVMLSPSVLMSHTPNTFLWPLLVDSYIIQWQARLVTVAYQASNSQIIFTYKHTWEYNLHFLNLRIEKFQYRIMWQLKSYEGLYSFMPTIFSLLFQDALALPHPCLVFSYYSFYCYSSFTAHFRRSPHLTALTPRFTPVVLSAAITIDVLAFLSHSCMELAYSSASMIDCQSPRHCARD